MQFIAWQPEQPTRFGERKQKTTKLTWNPYKIHDDNKNELKLQVLNKKTIIARHFCGFN